jgi:hypothetical protein
MKVTCFIRYQIDPFQREACRANFAFAQEKRLILREERTFLEQMETP